MLSLAIVGGEGCDAVSQSVVASGGCDNAIIWLPSHGIVGLVGVGWVCGVGMLSCVGVCLGVV